MNRLPTFPQESDMWTALKAETRPIVIYGMGNGADKLIARLDSLGIEFVDIFASDGFVRGHSFHGIRVKSFDEIKALYSQFVILVSFASSRTEVIKTVSDIACTYDTYIPDIPVSEEQTYFDKDFYNANFAEIEKALATLEDEKSKNTFISIIRYKLSGRIEDLLEFTSEKAEMYSLLPCEEIRVFCDAGAYAGDTLTDAVEFFPALERAVCIEPDEKTYKRLLRVADGISRVSVDCINAAAWDSNGEGSFSVSGNRNSSVAESSTVSFKHKTRSVSMIKIDDLSLERLDYLKYDVEGAEREAMSGARATVERCKPAMLVSAYHKSRDIFELVNDLHRAYPDYRLYLRRLHCFPAWEINIIAVPKTIKFRTCEG